MNYSEWSDLFHEQLYSDWKDSDTNMKFPNWKRMVWDNRQREVGYDPNH